MSWRTHPAIVSLRSLARAFGLTKILGRCFRTATYEKGFHETMVTLIRPGDTVWDVGANVGHYADQFCELVGPEGRVYAIEPSPTNLEALRRRIAVRSNAVVLPVGLGKSDSRLPFRLGLDELGATSRVAETLPTDAAGIIHIDVTTGDRLVASGKAQVPALLKIDTEGYELEVLQGLGEMLASPALRTVCLEVHFRLLAARGMSNAPGEIERILEKAGFKIAWPDSSHLIATRVSRCGP